MAEKQDQARDADTPSPSEQPAFGEIREILAERKQVAILWGVEDVQAVRPDLSKEQSWEVLQRAEDRHDPAIGINANSLAMHAEEMFPRYHEEEMPPEEWQRLKAEMTHDYGLRHMEDRGVKYEDEVERFFDHIAGGNPSPAPAVAARQPVGQVSPADLMESVLAEARAKAETARAIIKEPPIDVKRERSGQLSPPHTPGLLPDDDGGGRSLIDRAGKGRSRGPSL